MNPDLKGVWEHIRHLGLGALSHANYHAYTFSFENTRWPELSIVQAAHAAELLIKARIAQEHPLLIFEQFPRSGGGSSLLNLEDLFRSGRTIQWSDLPERLWAVTGLTLPAKQRFEEFGKLRNGIQHFAPAQLNDYRQTTLNFVFEVIDPFINQCWELFAIDYDEEYEPYTYFVPALISQEIPFLVSPTCATDYDNWDVDWDETSEQYKVVMKSRIQKARQPEYSREPCGNPTKNP